MPYAGWGQNREYGRELPSYLRASPPPAPAKLGQSARKGNSGKGWRQGISSGDTQFACQAVIGEGRPAQTRRSSRCYFFSTML
jgi:hypothetical protein